MADMPTLRGLREAKGSIRDAEQHTRIHRGAWSRYERGIAIPDPETADIMAPYLGVDASVIRFLAKQERARLESAVIDKTVRQVV